MTPSELAQELNVDPKRLRDFLRAQFPRSDAEKGQPWTLDAAVADAVRRHFRSR